MDRSVWTNRPRRTTMMGEKRSVSSKKSKKNVLKPTDVASNKENESRGLRRPLLGGHSLISKNSLYQTKEVSSRRSITRRLSFQKTEMDMADVSPSIHGGSSTDNYHDIDESMLFPLNSTAVMSSAPSPYRLDLLQQGDYKMGYPRPDKQLNSKYEYTKSASDKKIGLSDETKELLRKMGIDTSPDIDAAKQDSFRKIPERSPEEVKASRHRDIDPTISANQKVEVLGNSAATIEIHPETLDKDTQTTPKVLGDGAIFNVAMTLKSMYSRHFQEREELLRKQNKEIEEFLAKFTETPEGDINKPMEKLSHEDESRTCESQTKSLHLGGDKNILSNGRIEVSSVLQPPAENISSSLWKLTVQDRSQKEPVGALDNEEPPRGLTSILSPHGCNITDESIPSQTVCDTVCTTNDNCKPVGTNYYPVECVTASGAETWQRKLEVSLLETPQSGRWLVTEDLDGNITSTSTPTLGLSSMLKGMTIQGQQSFMETPATRRFVTQRILQGVESLFK